MKVSVGGSEVGVSVCCKGAAVEICVGLELQVVETMAKDTVMSISITLFRVILRSPFNTGTGKRIRKMGFLPIESHHQNQVI